MTEFWIDRACSGAYVDVPSEDVVGHVSRGESILIWAIDGASALTDRAFTVFNEESNSGWFARRLSECLESSFRSRPFDPVILAEIVKKLRQEFARSAGSGVADWTWPVAAAVMVEIVEADGGVRLEVFQYSDCFFSVACGDLGVDVMKRTFAAVAGRASPWKPASGFEGSRLEVLRDRRAQQQLNIDTTALTLNPASAMNVSRTSLECNRPLHLLVGSDGLARLWEIYGAMRESDAMSVVATSGVAALIAELRRIETAAVAVESGGKPVDDACGVHVFMPSGLAGPATSAGRSW